MTDTCNSTCLLIGRPLDREIGAYIAVSLSEVFPWFAEVRKYPEQAWLYADAPQKIEMTSPRVADFVVDRSNANAIVREPDDVMAMKSVLSDAQAMGSRIIVGAEVREFPVFASSRGGACPKHFSTAISLLARKLIDLPDVYVGIEAARAVWTAMNRRRGIEGANASNDPKLRRVELCAIAAEAEIPMGLFLPVEISTADDRVPAVVQLLARRNDGTSSCILHVADDIATPASGTVLRRNVRWKEHGSFREQQADIALIL